MAEPNGTGQGIAVAIGQLLEATAELKRFVGEQSGINEELKAEISATMNRLNRLTEMQAKLKERLDAPELEKQKKIRDRRKAWRNATIAILTAWAIAAGAFLAANWKSAVRRVSEILGGLAR